MFDSSFRPRLFPLLRTSVWTLTLALAAGCDQGYDRAVPSAANRAEPAPAETAEPAPAPAVAALDEAPSTEGDRPGTASPASDRDLQRQREFAEAIDGLSFQDGSVTVVQALDGGATAAAEQVRQGDALLASNRRTPAIKAFATAVRMDPRAAGTYVKLGQAFIATGRTEHAAAAYRTAIGLDEGDTVPRRELALTLAREGHTTEAIGTMQTVLAIDPDDGVAHERLAIWYYYQGQDQSAWEHVAHARRVGHTMPPQFMTLLQGRTPDPSAKAGRP